MGDFNINFVCVRHIDADNNVDSWESKTVKKYLDDYIEAISEKRIKTKSARTFKEKTGGSRVMELVKKIESYGKNTANRRKHLKEIASLLLQSESKAKAKVKKGILVQSLLKYKKEKYYFLAKIEPGCFLDKEDFTTRSGYPYEKHIMKSCLVKFVPNPGIETIRLFDSSGTIAAYWYRDFLELLPELTEVEKGEKPLLRLKDIFEEHLGEENLGHAIDAKNEILEFIENNRNIDVDKVKEIVENQDWSANPELSDIPGAINQTIDNEVETQSIPKSFTPSPAAIRQFASETIQLTSQIDLVLNDALRNLGNDICIEHTDTGTTYVRIRVAAGYTIPGFRNCN